MPGAPAVEAEDEFIEVGLEVLAAQPVLREADRRGQDRRSAWARLADVVEKHRSDSCDELATPSQQKPPGCRC